MNKGSSGTVIEQLMSKYRIPSFKMNNNIWKKLVHKKQNKFIQSPKPTVLIKNDNRGNMYAYKLINPAYFITVIESV